MRPSHRQKKYLLSRVAARLQHFRQQIICRKVPHTLVSWRFLCPGNNPAILLHRRVFLDAFNQHGRLLKYSIVIYSLLIWYGWQSWRQIYRSWSRLGPKLYEKLGTPRSLQLYDLLQLALLHGIPPIYYYQFRLFQQPPRKWLKFIYNHELPQWHTVMAWARQTGTGLTLDTARELLGDKSAFAEKMSRSRIIVIPTGSAIIRGTKPIPEQIFQQKNLFIKPNRANQCRNCYELHYDHKTQEYELLAIRGARGTAEKSELDNLETISGRENILKKLNSLTALEDFIIQPLITNHQEMVKAFAVDRLITIRLITGHDGFKVSPIVATLEVPRPDREKGWYLYAINLENGNAAFREHPLFASKTNPEVKSFTLPDWSAALELARRAHAELPALITIGWDLALTDHGPIIIEGNFNWGVNQSQIVTGIPLLEGRLLEVYEKRAGSLE